MKIGYIRVSTEEQNEARQKEALTACGVEKIFSDKKSGKNTDRAGYTDMMAFVREGDCVYVESISRIARNTRDLLDTVEVLHGKKVEFVSLEEKIDTHSPTGKFMLTVFGAMAELEREYILERQREGIEIAKREGKYTGRKAIEIDEKRFREICSRWRSGEITAVEAQRILGLKSNTFYRRAKDLEV